jgi:hypothetical protein
MPVKHGPKNEFGEVTVDKSCLWPGCRRWPMEGRLMCSDHEGTDEYKKVDESDETEEE